MLDVLWDPANLKTRVQTTVAAQLALYTTFYSPLQMLADTPENYAKHSKAFSYLHDMPTTWDDSKVDAEIGDHIVTSRRSGEKWYTGIVVDERDRRIPVPLDFLTPGKTYVAEVFTDAANASWKGNPTSIEVVSGLVTSTDTILADVVGAGGQAIRFWPATPDELTSVPKFTRSRVEPISEPKIHFEPGTGTVTVDVEAQNTGTVVTSKPFVLYVDGVAVATSNQRLGGNAKDSFTFEFGYTLTGDGSHFVAFGDEDGPYEPGEKKVIAALFDDTFRTRALELARAGELSPALGQQLATRSRAVEALTVAGELDAMIEGAQDLRIALYLTTEELSPAARTELDTLLDLQLGKAAGLMNALSLVPDLVSSSDLNSGEKMAIVKAAKDVFDATAAGYVDQIPALRGILATAATDQPVSMKLRDALKILENGVQVEAEEGTFTGNGQITKEHPGYTGTGFVKGLNSVGSGVSVSLNSSVAQMYDVTLRYANGMVIEPFNRELSVRYNNADPATVDLPRLSSASDRWRVWGHASAHALSARQGENTMTLWYSPTDTGNVNVDHMIFMPRSGVVERPAAEAETAGLDGPCVEQATSGFTGTGYLGCFTKANDKAEFALQTPVAGTYEVEIRYATSSSDDAALRVSSPTGDQEVELVSSDESWRMTTLTFDLPQGTNASTLSWAKGSPLVDSVSVRLIALPVGAADAPTNPLAALANDTIELSWEAPFDNGGSDIAGYRLWVTRDGVVQSPIEVAASSLEYVINPAAEGSTYSFVVAVITRPGEGTQSGPSNEVRVPGPPVRDIKVTAKASGRVELGAPATLTATVTGTVKPGDYLTFAAYRGGDTRQDPVCDASTMVFDSSASPTVVGAPGDFKSPPVTFDKAGTYHWVETLFASDGTVLHRGGCGQIDKNTVVFTDPVTPPTPGPNPGPTDPGQAINPPVGNKLPITGANILAVLMAAIVVTGAGFGLRALRSRRRVIGE